MTTFAWPQGSAFQPVPRGYVWRPRTAKSQYTAPLTGQYEAISHLAERWGCSVTLPACGPADAAAREAFFTHMVYGGHLVAMPRLDRSGEPLGTLRGAPTLQGTVARGAQSITLGGNLGSRNLLPWSGYQDADLSPPDGLVDVLSTYSVGASGAVSVAIGADDDAVRWQRVVAAALGASPSDVVGLRADVTAGPGTYTFSATMRANADLEVGISLQAIDSSGNGLAFASDAQNAAGLFARSRRSISVVAPAGTVSLRLRTWIDRNTDGGTSTLDMMQPQLELGAVATAYQGPVTVMAGDMLGLGAHLLQVQANATANDAGLITVPTVNRIRETVTAGTPAVWQSPTFNAALPRDALEFVNARSAGWAGTVTLDFVEAY